MVVFTEDLYVRVGVVSIFAQRDGNSSQSSALYAARGTRTPRPTFGHTRGNVLVNCVATGSTIG